MARSKQNARKGKSKQNKQNQNSFSNTDDQTSQNNQAGKNAPKRPKGDRWFEKSLVAPLTKWEFPSFLEHLHDQPCYSSSVNVNSLFNHETTKSQILNGSELSFGYCELQKLSRFRSFSPPVCLKFRYLDQEYHSKKLDCTGGIVIQATGSTQELANEAFAALVLAKVFGEGKLARYLFAKFLANIPQILSHELSLYRQPEPEMIIAGKGNRRDVQNVDIMDYPRTLTIDEFLSSHTESEPSCKSEKPKQLAQNMKTPSDVVFALKKIGSFHGEMRTERCNFNHRTYLIEGKFCIRNPNSPSAFSVYRAFGFSRCGARQACCALVLAHYFGDVSTARQLLEKFMKSSVRKVSLFENPGSSSKKSESICGTKSEDLRCSTGARLSGVKAFGLNHKPGNVVCHEELMNLYKSCNSPLDALRRKMGPNFSVDKFVFVPIFKIPDYEILYGCLNPDVMKEIDRFMLPLVSTSPYVALQLCCLNTLKAENLEDEIILSVSRKFLRAYRKEYECYGSVHTVDPHISKEDIIRIGEAASVPLLKAAMLEDEEFQNAVNGKRVLKYSPVDPMDCEYLHEKINLFGAFLDDYNRMTQYHNFITQQSHIGRLAEKVMKGVKNTNTNGFGDFGQFFPDIENEDVNFRVDFCNDTFYVWLFGSNNEQFISTSTVSFKDALNRAMSKLFEYHQALMRRNRQVFEGATLCCLLNSVHAKLGIDLEQLMLESLFKLDGGKWAGKISRHCRMPRKKRWLARDASVEPNRGSSEGILKPTKKLRVHQKEDYYEISRPPAQLSYELFIHGLHPLPASVTLNPSNLEALYNNKNLCCPDELAARSAKPNFWFPNAELKRLAPKSLSAEKIYFVCGVQKFCSRKLCLSDSNLVLQITTGEREDVALNAFAALVLSKVYNEGRLARFLFENFVIHVRGKRKNAMHLKIALYHNPEPETILRLISSTAGSYGKKNEANEKVSKRFNVSPKFLPNVIGNQTFFERKKSTSDPEYSREFPNPRLSLLELPSDILYFFNDIRADEFEEEIYIFDHLFIFGCRVHLDPSESQSQFEAFSNTAQNAQEALCALLIAHYYGSLSVAQKVLNQYVNMTSELILYAKPVFPGMPMGGLVQKENFLSTLQCKKAAPKSLYTSMRLTGPVGVRVPVLHGVPYEELNACYSPKQALEVLQSKPFQFEDLLFLPLSAKYSGRKVIGCSFRDENGSIGKQQYSSKAYVAMQMCCADRLCDLLKNGRLPSFLMSKFCRIYRKYFECFLFITLSTVFSDRQVLSYAKHHAPAFLEEVKLEDEYFLLALDERKSIKSKIVDPSECSNVKDQMYLFQSFLGEFADLDSSLELEFRESELEWKSGDTLDSETSHVLKLRLNERVESSSVEFSYCDNEFVAQLTVNCFYNFAAKSSESFEEALNQASRKALAFLELLPIGVDENQILPEELVESNLTDGFAIKTVVNFLKEHKLDISNIAVSYNQDDFSQNWLANISYRDQQFSNGYLISKNKAFIRASMKLKLFLDEAC